ncbi:hypothetical protein [Desulfoluna sp.]|nr:hypothetical protein [Desulfoluna sp.]
MKTSRRAWSKGAKGFSVSGFGKRIIAFLPEEIKEIVGLFSMAAKARKA